jgi:hypothetical protein
VCTLKFVGKIKESIKQKNNKKLSQLDAMLENETIRSKYTRDELEAAVKGAGEFRDAFDQQLKRKRREDRRRRAVEWAGGIFTFVGINGSFFILLHQFGIFTLLADKCRLGPTLSAWIIVVLWIGFAFLLALTFFWLSDKTGLHYLIEDWVVSWDTWDAQQIHNIHKYKTFPRRKRRTLIRDLKKELDVFSDFKKALEMKKELEESPDLKKKLDEFPDLKKALDTFNDQLFPFGKEAYDTDDEELSGYDDEELPDSVEGSVERINRVIGNLVEEADISSRRLISQPEHASWIGFVLTLEKTSTDLELELKDIAKYHKSIQPLLKLASNITSKALYRIIDFGNDKGKAAII